jgi:uncharacterized membrane protein
MAPLIALLATYVVARLVFRRRRDRTLPGRLALSVMLVVTGSAHFTMTDALADMVPPALPAPVLLVYASGIAELVFALLLLVRPTPALGWALVAFFLALLPANIYAAVERVGLGGHGPAYLWFRVPLQLLFIGWAASYTGAARALVRRLPADREPRGRSSA